MRSRSFSLRRNLVHVLCAGILSCLFFSSTHLAAQDDSEEKPAEEPRELEKMAVTGSRIKRIDAEGALPVTIIDRETIDRSGESSLAEFVRSLSFNTHGSYRSQNDGAAHGSAQISLRGLGSNRSLVLVDGRRLNRSPVSVEYQDLNVIPMGAVERIEVLSDGASAIYGSDAIAGVVNIITRDDYQGWELMYGLADTNSGGGDRDFGSAVLGHSGENWKLVATISFDKRDNTLNRDFDWFEPEYDWYGNNFTDIDPEFGYDLGNYTALPGACNGSDAFVLVPVPWAYDGLACVYDYNREYSNETSLDTAGLLVKFDYEFNPHWAAWLDFSASETEAYGQSAPMESWFSSPLPPESPNNPTNPASSMYDPVFGPPRPVNYWHTFEPLGNIETDRETNLGELKLGMSAWLEPFELDFGLRYTRSESEDFSRNMIRPEQADAFVRDGTYDLQDPWSNPEDVLAAMRHDQLLWWDFEQDEVFATVSWDGLDIGGLPLQWVFGAEFRREQWQRESRDDWDGPARYSDRDILALYFESLVPLTPNLELSLAGRYDDYSDWGDNFAPKVSLRWRALDQLVLRGSWGEGFRAPDLNLPWDDIYQWGDFTQNDPQSCEVIGQEPPCWIPFIHIDRISPALGPEKSDQSSVGLVWQPLDAFDLTLDYYDISIEDRMTYNWVDLLLWMDQVGEPPPPGLGVERDPQTGLLVSITTGLGNRGSAENSGFDLTMNLDFTLGPGSWHSNFLGSYNLEDSYDGWDAVGLSGVPQYRATLSNQYDISRFQMSWNVHYIASQDGEIPGWSSGYVPSWTTHDVQLAWNAPWGGRFDLGAQNVFNEQPVLDVGAVGGNRYNTLLYDAFGRILYIRYTQVF